MADITIEILKSIRTDIAGVRTDIDGVRADIDGVRTDVDGIRAEIVGVRADLDTTNREVRRLAVAVEQNSQRLGSMVSVLRLAVGREDDLDDRIRRLEAEVFGPPPG